MFQLSRTPIRTQLTVLLAVAALFLVSVAGVGAWGLMRSADFARHSHDDNMHRQRAGTELINAVSARAVAARNLTLAIDPTVREHELAKVKQAHEATQAAVKQLQTLTAHASTDERHPAAAVAVFRLGEATDAADLQHA
jgi:CHASE3 domain sensor protein